MDVIETTYTVVGETTVKRNANGRNILTWAMCGVYIVCSCIVGYIVGMILGKGILYVLGAKIGSVILIIVYCIGWAWIGWIVAAVWRAYRR